MGKMIPPVIIRAAMATDQAAIVAMVREAHLNPLKVAWQDFVVAERCLPEPQIIGVGQLRPHGPARELGSLVVDPVYQKLGIGKLLVQTLVARHGSQPLYLFCQEPMKSYYQRFGFVEVGRAQLPPAMACLYVIGRSVSVPVAYLTGRPLRMTAMRRQPGSLC
jgi:N-acetylglutamate synthase-like GNAT family acetyltransferase